MESAQKIYMTENTRNFCIISHVDHGKSTLSDRFLELTGTVEKRKMQEQFLDIMPLEREKGITIKMQPVRMEYKGYVLNLIDTPGHVDFAYEVSRSLAAVEGVILLVDAAKGIQAQTLANLELAKEQGLVVIPAINKIDLPLAKADEVAKELAELLSVTEQDIFHISAKLGTNVEELLMAVIDKFPAPKGEREKPLRALIFDSRYDAFLGVVVYVRIIDGSVRATDKVRFLAAGSTSTTKEVGYFLPQEQSTDVLVSGDIGYIATGIKAPDKVRIGDTVTERDSKAEPLLGYKEPKQVVFVSLYPQDPDAFDLLKDAITKLKLNDPSFTYEPESREALGRGFRCGFLGVLHSEIISERIQREFSIDLVMSRPSVEFQVLDRQGKEISVQTASDWPDAGVIEEVREPWVALQVICPTSFYSAVIKVLQALEGKSKDISYLGEHTVMFKYEVPLREIIIDLYDTLKSVTQGLASMDYEITGYYPGNLVKLDILIAGTKEEALSQIVSKDRAYQEGKTLVAKLKKSLPPQLFSVPLQAVIGGKVLARETIKAKRRDVTESLYGGDVTRKRKLLEKQKKGKKELAQKGRVRIPSKVFLDLFRS